LGFLLAHDASKSARSKSERMLMTVFFSPKRTAQCYAREHFMPSEQERVRILSGK
jgi:hypothetical protein